jgi:tetratricopeptide (TPR) repeat protein
VTLNRTLAMKQELWRRAEDLFHAVLERPPEARRAFLDEACAEDTELRRQVEMLVSKDEQAGSFLEKPVMFSEAIAEALEGVRLSSGLPLARGWAAYALAMAGRQAEALAILDQLEELSRQRYVPAAARVWCYLGLGDLDRAIEWLEHGYQQRDSQLPHVGLLRAFDPLHPDSRFQDLLRRLGIPQ